jgi:hypothetical protein
MQAEGQKRAQQGNRVFVFVRGEDTPSTLGSRGILLEID